MSAEPSAPPASAAPLPSEAGAAFAARAATVSTDVRAVATADVPALVIALLRDAGAHSVALESPVAAAFPTLGDTLRGVGLALVAADAPPAVLAEAAAGLSLAAFGIVETGSVAIASPALGDRLTGMLPTEHIVLLRASDLVADLDAAAARLRAWATGDPPRPYVSFITGPSRTADIERVLTIGVQGPCALHVVLVSDA
ncbi:MAG TPA: LUD domain-containing protein [Chloroflexota bacterium]|nr:LUD domain-containing protein [Chloroflexota bacterium]